MKKAVCSFLCLALLIPLTFLLCRADSDFHVRTQKKKKDWIEGPVGYIITEEEKKHYNKLKTEEEKEKFIKWFWARRDPNPVTYRNEFQHEFNRRVSYANTHFKEGRLEGWETARGRVYIVFGPPAEVKKEIIPFRPTWEDRTGRFLIWIYHNPPSHYLRAIGPLFFAELYGDGRWFLLRPMPRDQFEYYFQRRRPQQYFELVPDEYFRAFEEVNRNAIQKPDLEIAEVEGKEGGEDISATEEIPFQWKVDFVPSADDKIQVDITITLKYKDIIFYQKESKYKADLDLSVKLFLGEESSATELHDEINVQLTEEELIAKTRENLEYKGSLVVSLGEYTIKITMEDTRTHMSKTVTEQLPVVSKSE